MRLTAAAILMAAATLCGQELKDLAILRYVDLQTGTGAQAAAGKRFTVHYTGWLKDGTKFDSSLDRNEPFSFVQGRRQVIAGWDVGFEGMRAGGRRKLIIPYQFAYGEQGSGPIPAKAELTFEVELLNVEDAPTVAPAIDLIIPFKDLEARALRLAGRPRDKESALSERLERIRQLNTAYLQAVRSDKPAVTQDSLKNIGEVPDLPASFAELRKELEQARNGSLGADARWMGQNTTRRGLFTALLAAVSEEVALAENLTPKR